MYILSDVIDELKMLAKGKTLNITLPDDDAILSYEKRIGFRFNEDYKKVLKEISNIVYGTIELASISGDQEYYHELSIVLEEARSLGVPKDWLPICEDNSNYYCITPDNKVRYWAHDGAIDESWPDLATWIKEVWIEGG